MGSSYSVPEDVKSMPADHNTQFQVVMTSSCCGCNSMKENIKNTIQCVYPNATCTSEQCQEKKFEVNITKQDGTKCCVYSMQDGCFSDKKAKSLMEKVQSFVEKSA